MHPNIRMFLVPCSFFTIHVLSLTAHAGTVIFVDADVEGANNGTSWSDAFHDLHNALSASQAGDELWIAAGTYRPAPAEGDRSESFELKSGVALYGGFAGTEQDRDQRDPSIHFTIVSGDLNGDDSGEFQGNAENSYNVFDGLELDSSTILDGLQIVGGNADGIFDQIDEFIQGGGIRLVDSSPTLTNCVFSSNVAFEGGGLYAGGGAPVLSRCTFRGNRVNDWKGFDTSGAGLLAYFSAITLTECCFEGNLAEGYGSVDGGGMRSVGGSPYLESCTFIGNTVAGSFGSCGGGMSSGGGTLVLIGCSFIDNVVLSGEAYESGGGLDAPGDDPATLLDCTFLGNIAASYGGGFAGHGNLTNCLLVGNLAYNNGGGASSSFYYPLNLTNCTVFGNTAYDCGGGVDVGFVLSSVANSILWENVALYDPDSSQINGFFDFPPPSINYSIVQDWTGELGGVGNNGDDPRFVDPDGADDSLGTLDDNLRLSAGSAAIDSGDNFALPTDAFDLDDDDDFIEPVPFDLDGLPRMIDDPARDDTGNPPGASALVDRGAYEYQPPQVCEGDVNDDGTVDPLDLGFIQSRFGCPVGTGDPACDASDVNGDTAVDPLDVGYVQSRFGVCP